jgi:transcriptional regulator with XRE-family HTH domain
MDERNNNFDLDFTPIGQAIKRARTTKGMTREQLARIIDYDPRHLQILCVNQTFLSALRAVERKVF